MVEFLAKRGWISWLATLALDSDWLKRKGNIKSTAWKYTLKSIVHCTWKEYENSSVSLLMAK